MRDVYIINPASGKIDNSNELKEKLYKVYGLDVKVLITSGVGDALVKARAEAETGDDVRIFACGGDGTSFEVLNGIVGYKNAAIGVIPIGSANDFIKYFGFDSKKDFLDINKQREGTLYPIDLIKVNDKYCMNQCCVGMDAHIADRMKNFKRLPFVSGPMAYNLALVRTIFGKIGIKASITVDDKEFADGSFLFGICANAPVYGGGYISAPSAEISDGELDCITIDKISRFRFPKLIPTYKKGKHMGLDICKAGKCKTFELKADRPVPISLDGEIIHSDYVRCEIAEKAINLVVPKGYMSYLEEKENKELLTK